MKPEIRKRLEDIIEELLKISTTESGMDSEQESYLDEAIDMLRSCVEEL